MNTRQEILALLRGQQIGKIPVSLYKIDPYDEKSFWAGHASFSHRKYSVNPHRNFSKRDRIIFSE